jgi:hypothetical protein
MPVFFEPSWQVILCENKSGIQNKITGFSVVKIIYAVVQFSGQIKYG